MAGSHSHGRRRVAQFPSPQMIFDKAGCVRRKGVPLRSTERAEERAPLTAAASGQVIALSGAKKTKENL